MSILDRRRRQNPPAGDTGDSALDQLTDVREEVPEVDDAVDALNRALTEPVTQERSFRGCSCWG